MRLFRRGRKSFKKELRRQLKLAIMTAIGFLIAFAWRNAIWESSRNIIEKFTETTRIIMTNVLTAIFITLIGVILIIITSKILRD